MKLAVITGATGFVGPFVVRALRQRFPDVELRCVVRPTSRVDQIRDAGVSTAVADLRDPRALADAFAGADTLVNVASLGFDWTDNVVSTAEHAGITRAVFVGTTAILTRLAVPSKTIRARAEQLIRESRLQWTLLRPTMIYGTPGDRNIARLIRFVEQSPVVPLVAPHALQQPIHVEDVAWAVAAVLGAPATIGLSYNISGREPIALRALVGEVAAGLGKRRLLLTLPLAPLIAVMTLWARVARPPIKVEQLRRIEEDKSFDYADAARDFGFSPRDFRTGITAAIEAHRKQGRPPA
jgi:nucleoside-diphosphate-sugar epimerase